MKDKKKLWMCIIAMVSVLFIVILFGAASASKSATEGWQEETASQEEQPSKQKEEEKTQEEIVQEEMKVPAEDVYEGEIFTFTADGFSEQFSKNLPEGYRFEDRVVANPRRNNRLQLDIVDENGASTDIAIIFNVEDTNLLCKQVALTIKTDCFADDADVMLKWYLFTFLEGFEEEQKRAIYDEYLYIFDSGSEEYGVHAEGSLTAMMSCETEEAGEYYYVLISAE